MTLLDIYTMVLIWLGSQKLAWIVIDKTRALIAYYRAVPVEKLYYKLEDRGDTVAGRLCITRCPHLLNSYIGSVNCKTGCDAIRTYNVNEQYVECAYLQMKAKGSTD